MLGNNYFVYLALLCVTLVGCSSKESDKKNKTTLTVEASSVPQAEMLEQIQGDLEQEGIHLKIIVVDDYQIPNRALAAGEIDANFFQHKLFLEEQIEQFHYPICSLAEIHIEPMGIYTEGVLNLRPGSVITVPNDPTNESRALLLLQKAGWIHLRTAKDQHQYTILDIEENPHRLQFREIDPALLTRTLQEVDAAVIPTNYALLGGLSPQKDAILLESPHSDYVNIIAVRCKDLNKPELEKLKTAMQSEKMRAYIVSTYHGAVVSAF